MIQMIYQTEFAKRKPVKQQAKQVVKTQDVIIDIKNPRGFAGGDQQFANAL